MKWFRHETDAIHSEKLALLISKFGFEGYGRYWRIMELVAERMDETGKCYLELPEKDWLRYLSVRRPLLHRYLVVICQLFDIKQVTTGLLIRIEIPNLLKKRDYATLKKRQRGTMSPLEVEVEVEVESKVHKGVGKKAKNKTNPEIKILLDFYHTNFLKTHGFKPETGGKAAAIFTKLLKSRKIDDLKKLVLAFLMEGDPFIAEAGWPVNLLPTRINSLIKGGALKREMGENLKTTRIVEEFSEIEKADFSVAGITDWEHRITQLKIKGSKNSILSSKQIDYLNNRLKELNSRRAHGGTIN